MGAWDDLTIDEAEVRGLAEHMLTDRQSGSSDLGLVLNSYRREAAKGEVESVLWDEGKLAQWIDDAGGVDALLDDIASNATLEPRLQRGLALAVLALFSDDDAVVPGGRTVGRSDTFQSRLETWARGFGKHLPFVLGYTSKASSGGGGGAFATSMSRYET